MGGNIGILVVGCGSIGERHIKNLKQYFPEITIFAHDLDRKRLKFIKAKYLKVKVFHKLEDALKENISAVMICTPPSTHINIALEAVNRDLSVFIEKPLSDSLEKVGDLIKLISKKGLIGCTGYNFRFHEGLILINKMLKEGNMGDVLSANAEFGQYLPTWRAHQDYRENYITKVRTGGGIILDGSHEIDYLCWILGKPKEIFCFKDKVSELEMETEDVAEILLKFRSKTLGRIHLDCIRPLYSRKCELMSESHILTWDYVKKSVEIYDIKTNAKKIINTNRDNNHMYVHEIENFIGSLMGEQEILTDLKEGQKSLDIALKAKKSAEIRGVLQL
jgi:predicted dehydrogenase